MQQHLAIFAGSSLRRCGNTGVWLKVLFASWHKRHKFVSQSHELPKKVTKFLILLRATLWKNTVWPYDCCVVVLFVQAMMPLGSPPQFYFNRIDHRLQPGTFKVHFLVCKKYQDGVFKCADIMEQTGHFSVLVAETYAAAEKLQACKEGKSEMWLLLSQRSRSVCEPSRLVQAHFIGVTSCTPF